MKKLAVAMFGIMVAASSFLAGTAVFAQGGGGGQGFSTDNPYLKVEDGGSTDNLNVFGSGTGQKDTFVNVVRGAINRVLGILALIALILLLWGGFQMVTAAGDDAKYKAGFTILKQAAIGLILIGVAWFVISIIFFVINLITTQAGQDAGTGA
jgi:hypothetical protein